MDKQLTVCKASKIHRIQLSPVNVIMLDKGPISLRESVSAWWNYTSLEDAEKEVLSFLPFFPESDGKRAAKLAQVDIGDGLVMNEFSIQNIEPVPERKRKLTLVMIHGFSESLVFYYRNYDALSSIPGITLYSLDQMGFGRSSKPKFRGHPFSEVNLQGQSIRAIEGESYFVDAIEKWRLARNINNKFIFMGHSLGGYVAGAYAMKYPQYVEKVIFVSPAGVERGHDKSCESLKFWDVVKNPFKKAHRIPQHLPKFSQELFSSAVESMRHRDGLSEEELGHLEDEYKAGEDRLLPNWLVYFFMIEWTPFDALKYATFMGPRFVSEWASIRFSYLEPKERAAIFRYIYGSLKDYTNGTVAFRAIFGPGVAARNCLRDRLDDLKCPSIWLYGANDFISPVGAQQSARYLNKGDGITYRKASVYVLNRCAHHLHVENPKDFHKLVIRFLEDKPKL